MKKELISRADNIPTEKEKAAEERRKNLPPKNENTKKKTESKIIIAPDEVLPLDTDDF